jgi:sulfur carrier protein
MKLQVNGEIVTITPPCSVTDLLAERGLAEQPCAVEVNRSVVPKRDHDDRALQEGDVVEIVTLVGGG